MSKEITRQILLLNNFNNPDNYFCVFNDSFSGIELFKHSLSKPNEEKTFKRYEGIAPTEYGFCVVFDHGKLCEPSFLRFPKFATEEDFSEAFKRLWQFIEMNYQWEPGGAPYLWGD